MPDEKELRKEIFEKVREIYALRKSEDRFVPGKSRIEYGGRIYDEKEMISLVDASLDFWLTTGRYAKEFEEGFADFLGVDHCLIANSGSSANLLAISALTSPELGKKRIRKGDEVITTACGFPTTLNPIIQNNLTPVFVDIELGTYNIMTERVAEAITEKTKAIFIPHILGNPAKIRDIMEIAEEHNLWFIEDNCDAVGSKYEGKYTGSFGHISTASFYPAHHMTMGEGGAVLTNDLQLKRIIASFRDWGRACWCEPGKDDSCNRRFDWQIGKLPYGYDHKYTYTHIGYNLKVTDMQAAIGVQQLKKLPQFIEKRKDNYALLYSKLKKYEDYFIMPKATAKSDPCWFGFPLCIKESAPFKRDSIVRFLEDSKIATRMLFGGNLLKQPAYEDIEYKTGSLENTDIVMNNLFWVGVYPGITREKLEYMTDKFDRFIISHCGR